MLDEVLKDHRVGQDSMQLGSFVLGGRTKWGTYKQAIRELYKRIRGLRQMITERDLLLLDIEEKEELILSEELSERDQKREKIRLRSLTSQLEEAERSIQDTKREAAIFYKVSSDIKKDLGEITEEKRVKLDREEWKWWHLKRAAIDKLTTGRVSEVVLKNLCSLPINEREEWSSIIKSDQKLMELFENSEYGKSILEIPDSEDIKLIEREIS